jgi:hypothetical protein
MFSNYIADAYETYSSSAQAAQSFARNIASAIFPLFARQLVSSLAPLPASLRSLSLRSIHRLLRFKYGGSVADDQYEGIGYPQASSLVGGVALFLSAAPVLLIIYGKDLRARSKVASALEQNRT